MRDERGRFTKGNAGGPGRPSRETEVSYLQAIGDAVSLDDWREIVEMAVRGAKKGDYKDRAWLSKHLVGDASVSADEIEQLLKDSALGRFFREMADRESGATDES